MLIEVGRNWGGTSGQHVPNDCEVVKGAADPLARALSRHVCADRYHPGEVAVLRWRRDRSELRVWKVAGCSAVYCSA